MLVLLACGDDGGEGSPADASTGDDATTSVVSTSSASMSSSGEPTSVGTTMTSSSSTTDAVDSSSATTDPAPSNQYSVQLDGVSAHVNLGSRDAVLGSEESSFTVAVWVRLASIPPGDELSGDGIFFIEGKAGFGDGLTIFWSTEKDEPSIAFYPPGALGGLRGTPANPTGWTHVVAVYEPGLTAALYLDGRLAVQAIPEGGELGATGDVLIGRYIDDSFATEGFFDDVAIWNIVLSTEAIESIYSSAGAGAPQDLTTEFGDYAAADSLLGYWRMGDDDDGMGTTVSDVLGNNNGTLESGAVFSNEVP